MTRRLLLSLLFCTAAAAQSTGSAAPGGGASRNEKFNHVQWTLELQPASAAPGATILGKLQAVVEPEWHVYSLTTPPGPIPTSIRTLDSPAIESVTIFEPPPVKKFDPNFNAETETYEGTQVFYAKILLKKDLQPGTGKIAFEPRYQTCSGTSCIPPRTRQVSADLTIAASARAAEITIPGGYIEVKPRAPKPVSNSGSAPPASDGLGAFLAIAFGFGLASIFTPCVFPMIPITMSYFVGDNVGGLRQAIAFCLGIMILFSGLGLAVTAALGPAGVVQLGSNAWVNGFITLIFLAFGLSLLGAFEITVPAGVLTKLNSVSGQGNFVGTVLMGLTFALASFACVGPFMGTLLAASVGDKTRPVLGMIVFSAGLAMPFFLLALFPQYLKKLPRSGEWLSRVKVVMGFLVLAFMLKYLYSLDAVLQTGFVTRERFLAAAVTLLVMAGAYLLGYLRLPGVSADKEMGVGRLLAGAVFVITGLSLVPGMFGARLGEIEAYIPPPSANSISGGSAGASGSADLAWVENDLPAAFAKAKAEGKRVLVNFTGYACTNCHWMKANMFTRPEINGVMKNMVLVDLYTDGTDAASAVNQKLEEDKFQTVAIPFYVLYDGDQNVLATFPSLTRNSQEYLAFLNTSAAPGAAAPVVADASPALDGAPFRTLEGLPLSTAAWSGKIVVLNYWATWCVPCRSEIPEFNKIHDEMAARGVEVVGISMDDDGAESVKPFLKTNPMKYTVGLGTGSFPALPVTVILDRSGRQIKRFDGLASPAEIRAAILSA